MRHRFIPSLPPALWARFAAALSFVAVLSALLAPASMLAQEVLTGKLGGICSAGAAWHGDSEVEVGAGNTVHAAAHCELCASLGLVLPPLVVATIPCFAGHDVASVAIPENLEASDPGLPFNRGPPAG